MMRTALITTTIGVPAVLSLYRKIDWEVRFFVATDLKTTSETYEFLAGLPRTEVLAPRSIPAPLYAPDNSIQKRNNALLAAFRWGADIIVSVDDDNIPLGSYFYSMRNPIHYPFAGPIACSPEHWFDVGTLLDPISPHRGFPISRTGQRPRMGSVVDAKIGVTAGICLGDPDISAVTRIANAPTVHRVSELLPAGVVVDPSCWTVFNSQNTAICRELAPAWMMWPGVGRYDDIFASLVVQRVARECGLHVHFGQPFVWQQRNQHDLVQDLKAEILGMEHVVHLAGILDDMNRFAADKPIVRQIWEKLAGVGWIPRQTVEAGFAWCDAVEAVL
jgi:hypothetical protein